MREDTKRLIEDHGESVTFFRKTGSLPGKVKALEVAAPFEGEVAYDSGIRIGDIVFFDDISQIAMCLAVKPIVMNGFVIRYDCTFLPCIAGVQVKRKTMERDEETYEPVLTWLSIFESFHSAGDPMVKIMGSIQTGVTDKTTIIISKAVVKVGDRIVFVEKTEGTGSISTQGSTLIGTDTSFGEELTVGQMIYSGPNYVGIVEEITNAVTAVLEEVLTPVTDTDFWVFVEIGETDQIESIEKLHPGSQYGCLRLALIEDER